MWRWHGSFSTSGGSWGWQLLQGSKDSHYMFFPPKNNTDIFHFCIISSHFVGVSLMEFCPVQPCLLQAKHPGLDSTLPWHFHLPMTKAFPKKLNFTVLHLSKNWKQTVKHCILEEQTIACVLVGLQWDLKCIFVLLISQHSPGRLFYTIYSKYNLFPKRVDCPGNLKCVPVINISHVSPSHFAWIVPAPFFTCSSQTWATSLPVWTGDSDTDQKT